MPGEEVHVSLPQPPFWMLFLVMSEETISEDCESAVKDFLSCLPNAGAGYEFRISLRANRFVQNKFPFQQKSGDLVPPETIESYQEAAKKLGVLAKEDCSLNIIPVKNFDGHLIEPCEETGAPTKLALSGARVMVSLDQLYTTAGPAPLHLTSLNTGFSRIRITEESETKADQSKCFVFDLELKRPVAGECV